MKVYIQSKSGNHNSTLFSPSESNLYEMLKLLRRNGGYYAQGRKDKDKFVPFEEIEYIEEAE